MENLQKNKERGEGAHYFLPAPFVYFFFLSVSKPSDNTFSFFYRCGWFLFRRVGGVYYKKQKQSHQQQQQQLSKPIINHDEKDQEQYPCRQQQQQQQQYQKIQEGTIGTIPTHYSGQQGRRLVHYNNDNNNY